MKNLSNIIKSLPNLEYLNLDLSKNFGDIKYYYLGDSLKNLHCLKYLILDLTGCIIYNIKPLGDSMKHLPNNIHNLKLVL